MAGSIKGSQMKSLLQLTGSSLALATIVAMTASASLLSTTAHAGASEFEDLALQCAVLVDGKVVVQEACVADGVEHGGAAYGGGLEISFDQVGMYRNIKVSEGCTMRGDQCVTYSYLNGKTAETQLRTPELKLLTPAQIRDYERAHELGFGSTKLYSCLFGAGHDYEFCYAYVSD